MIVDRMTALAEKANGAEPALGASALLGRFFRCQRQAARAGPAAADRAGSFTAGYARLGLLSGGRVVITGDGRGAAAELAALLQAAFIPVDQLGGPDHPVDWSSPSAVEAAVERIRAQGPIAGIVHALPLGHARDATGPEPDWAGRLSDEVRGLFLLAKAVASDLEHAARGGGACLIAATAMGGRFASSGSAIREFFPGSGGVAGLVKTLAREWPEIRCRVVDFAPDARPETIAAQLADEILVSDGYPEVGYEGDHRIRLRSVAAPLVHAAPALDLKPGEPVLISGGARGITALVAAELARHLAAHATAGRNHAVARAKRTGRYRRLDR